MKREVIVLKGIIYLGLAIIAFLCLFLIPYRGISSIETFDFPDVFFVVMVYGTLVPLAYALWHSRLVLTHISLNQFFDEINIGSVRQIGWAAFSVFVLYLLAMPVLFWIAQVDDAPGLAAIGLIVMLSSLVIYLICSLMQKIMRKQ